MEAEGHDEEEGAHEQTWQTKSDHLLCVIDARRDMFEQQPGGGSTHFEAAMRDPEVVAILQEPAVQALLAKAPTERPASGEELIAALEDAEARAQQPYRSVLLVDDDPDFRALLRACFECELRVQNVVEAGSGPEALEALRGAHYDLVVVDLNLGEGPNGLELTAAIRERHPAHELGILVVTGQGSASDWRVLSRLGADAFVVKPLEPDAFITTARRLLEEG